MIVIKFGGHAMTDEHGAFAKAIAEAIASGVTPVIVHGGGPQIGEALKAAGIDSHFVGGFRVTTPETFTVVESKQRESNLTLLVDLESRHLKPLPLWNKCLLTKLVLPSPIHSLRKG